MASQGVYGIHRQAKLFHKLWILAIGSHIAEVGFKLSMWLRVALNSRSSHLYLKGGVLGSKAC